MAADRSTTLRIVTAPSMVMSYIQPSFISYRKTKNASLMEVRRRKVLAELAYEDIFPNQKPNPIKCNVSKVILMLESNGMVRLLSDICFPLHQ